jgi:uncharacterized protein (TIGR02466 family)
MSTRTLFATRLYQAAIDDQALLGELAHSIRTLAADDEAGKRWSRDKGYAGYTSYPSLNDLPRRDPAFADLQRLLQRHASAFAQDLAFELGRKPRLDSLWVNLLKPGGHHSAHIHPHSILSGTLYVEVPADSGSIQFEDPRLPMMMAAPVRRDDAPDDMRAFVAVAPSAGMLLMWESWLRHEVLPGRTKADRLSISFNFS